LTCPFCGYIFCKNCGIAAARSVFSDFDIICPKCGMWYTSDPRELEIIKRLGYKGVLVESSREGELKQYFTDDMELGVESSREGIMRKFLLLTIIFVFVGILIGLTGYVVSSQRQSFINETLCPSAWSSACTDFTTSRPSRAGVVTFLGL